MAHVSDSLDTVSRERAPRSRMRAWGLLAFFSVLIWVFGAFVGPWIIQSIPTFKKIVQVIEEQDINSNAYFYTEIEASYDGEIYLRDSIKFAGHRDAEFNLIFMSVVALSIVFMCLGFWYLPDD